MKDKAKRIAAVGLGVLIFGFIIGFIDYEVGTPVMILGGIIAFAFGIIYFVSKNQPQQDSVNTNSTTYTADELAKYKDLLDNGVISQEEFDAKKKQLLGL